MTFPQLESQLDAQETERTRSQRSVRNVDRVVKDLQGQLDRKDKQNSQLQEDVSRLRDKADKLLRTIDELQSSESSNQLSARRAERELREEREKSLRLERELEGWKSLRMERSGAGSIAGSHLGVGSVRRAATWRTGVGGAPAGEADDTASIAASVIDVPKRKSSLSRQPSLTKGFI